MQVAEGKTPQAPSLATPVRMLFLGDSIDEYLLAHTCKKLKGQHPETHYNRTVLHYCIKSPTNVSLGHWHIPGVHMTGPYYLGLENNAIERTNFALEHWRHLLKDSSEQNPVDVVMMAAANWDIGRVVEHEKQQLGNCLEAQAGGGPQLRHAFSPQFLESWAANFTLWAHHVRSHTPTALHVVRTSAMAKFNHDTGLTKAATLCSGEAVAQLNAALRHTAHKLGMAVLDMEHMARGLPDSAFLMDDFHSSPSLNAEGFNILLNLHVQHQRTLQAMDIKP